MSRLQRALGALTHAPRQRGPRAPVEAVRDWVAFAKAEHNLTLQAMAERIGMKSSGPIGAAMRGRPLSADRLRAWQTALKASKPGRSTRRQGQRRTPAEKVAAGKARVARRRKKEQPVAAAPGGTVRHQPASHHVIQRANASKE